MVKYRPNLKVIASPNFAIGSIKFNSNGSRILENKEELSILLRVPNEVQEFSLADGTIVNPKLDLKTKKRKEEKTTNK